MINGVITGKLLALEKAISELRSLGQITEQELAEDWMKRRAVERNLQITVEVVIDICHRIISLSNQTPPTNAGEAIERVVQLGVLSSAQPYRTMVRFRNMVVHNYEQIHVAILVDIVNNKLNDFEKFRAEIVAYAQT